MAGGSHPGEGWHPDPEGVHEWRWWDGARWGDAISDGGVTAIDELDDVVAAAQVPVAPAADARWLRPLTVGEIIDAAVKIYRTRFGSLVCAAAAVVIPVRVFEEVVTLSLPIGGSSGARAGALAASFLSTILVGVAGTLVTAACLKIVADAYLGVATTWRESLRFGFSKLRSLVWITILTVLGVMLGFVFLVVPGIWAIVAWSVAVPVLLFEGIKGSDALGRSRALVRDRWWPTFAVLLVTLLVTNAVWLALTQLVPDLLFSGGDGLANEIATAIGRAIGELLTAPITAAVTVLIYFELRVRKEGFDLELMARQVGVPDGAAASGPAGATGGSPPPSQAPWTDR